MTEVEFKEVTEYIDGAKSHMKTWVTEKIWNMIYDLDHYTPDDIRDQIIKKHLNELFKNDESPKLNLINRGILTKYYRYPHHREFRDYHIKMIIDMEKNTRIIKMDDE